MIKEKELQDKKENILSYDDVQKLDRKVKDEIDMVRTVIYQSSLDFHNYVFPKYINNYKKYLGFVGDRLSKIDGWQSNINYPMVSSAVDTMFANIFDFGYQIGVSEEGLKAACIKAFDFRSTGKNVLKEVSKEALICGKGYARDYFIKETFRDKFFDREISFDLKMPSMQYLSIFDVMYDRSKGIEKSSYKIIRTFATGDSIKEKVLPLLFAKYEKSDRDRISKKFDQILKRYHNNFTSRFSMYDYNPVKALTSVTQWMNSDSRSEYFNLNSATKKDDLLGGFVGGENTMNMSEHAKNYFLNANKSTYELVEYNTNDKKYIFVNGFIIYFGDVKYNLSKIREVTFSIVPGTGNANGMADKLTGHQDLQNTLWNAFIDNIKLLLGPMFKVTGNLPMGKNGKIDYGAFRTFKTNGTADIEKVQLGATDFGPANFMQMNEAAAIKESGMSNYISGGTGSIERVQAGVDLKFNQYKSKLTPLTDGIDQLMGNIIRSWIFMFMKFYTKEELKKFNIEIEETFTIDEKGDNKFDTILVNKVDIKDIIDESKISFTYNSLDKITKENSRDVFIQNFQYIAQYMSGSLNIEEIGKVFSGKDFDPLKVLIKKEQSEGQPVSQQQGQQYEQGGYNQGGGQQYNQGGDQGYNQGTYNQGGSQYTDGQQPQMTDDELYSQLEALV